MQGGSYSKLCSGNILPSVFVVLQSDDTVQAGGANSDVWGISQPYTHLIALSGIDDTFAGISGGPPMNIYGPGDDECLLQISGTVTAGNLIKSRGQPGR